MRSHINSSVALLIRPHRTKQVRHPPAAYLHQAVSRGAVRPPPSHDGDGCPRPGPPDLHLSVWAAACRRTSPDAPSPKSSNILLNNKKCRKRLPLSLVTPVLTADAATQSQATLPSDLGITSGHLGLSARPLPRAEMTNPDVEGWNSTSEYDYHGIIPLSPVF